MKIIALPDIHEKISCIAKFEQALKDADVVVLPGDITMFGGADAANNVIMAISVFNSNILAVAGNCDYEDVQKLLALEQISLHAKVRIINDVAFFGVGGSLECPAKTPGEITENDFSKFLDTAINEVPVNSHKILVCHQPPIGTRLDIVHGKNVGSHSIRKFIEKYAPAVCFCGHVHEGVGVDNIGNTKIINPGPAARGQYAYVEFDNGVKKIEVRRA